MMTVVVLQKVFPVLWHLVCDDIFKVWEICPIFQKCNALHVIIADPIEVFLSRFYNPIIIIVTKFLFAFSLGLAELLE